MFPGMSMTTEKTAIYNQGFWGFIQGEDIVRGDVYGNNQVTIGKTKEAYDELLDVCMKYYNKLIELGAIEKEKTPEEVALEQQQTLVSLAEQNSIILNQLREMQQKMAELSDRKPVDEDKVSTLKGNTLSLRENTNAKSNSNHNPDGSKSSASR